MKIYIDESGGFIVPEQPASRVSCVVALVIPDSDVGALFADFALIRSAWLRDKKIESKEVKGSALTDEQVETVLWCLGRYDVVAEIAMIDAGSHSPEEIRRLRQVQADKIVKYLTPQHHPELRAEMERLRDEWLQLSEQLIVQMYVMLAAIDSVIRYVTLYYAQRRPKELGRFDWIIDPKDIGRTRYERVWEMVICPFLQDLSLRQPMIVLKGADYSAFDRFNSKLTEMPEELKDRAKIDSTSGRFLATDVGKVMRESVAFPDSKSEIGLQLADVVANTLARAMNQKLPKNVWRHLGSLTIQKEKGHHSIHPILLTADEVEPGTIRHDRNYHGSVLEVLDSLCKPMLVRRRLVT